MKRKLSTINKKSKKSKKDKKRKYKYEYTPDMKNQPVPLHYIYDRLATDEQIEELETQLELRKNIYDNMGEDIYILVDGLDTFSKSTLDGIVFEMIDDKHPISEIGEVIEQFLCDYYELMDCV